MIKNYLTELNPNVRFVNHIENAEQKNHYIPWRILYDYEFLFITSGKLTVVTENKTYEVIAGQLHIMSPFVYHKRVIEDGIMVSYYNMHLDLFFNNNLDDDFSVDNIYIKPTIDPYYTPIETPSLAKRKKYKGIIALDCINFLDKKIVVDFFEKSFDTYSKINEFNISILKSKALVFDFLHYLFYQCEKNNKHLFSLNKQINNDVLSSFVSFIKNNYNQELKLNEISKSFGISQNYLYKLFKGTMGISPQEYILDFRIQESKKLLLSQKYYIGEIAAMVGYPNVYYFSRLFKQKEGISPKQFVKDNI